MSPSTNVLPSNTKEEIVKGINDIYDKYPSQCIIRVALVSLVLHSLIPWVNDCGTYNAMEKLVDGVVTDMINSKELIHIPGHQGGLMRLSDAPQEWKDYSEACTKRLQEIDALYAKIEELRSVPIPRPSSNR